MDRIGKGAGRGQGARRGGGSGGGGGGGYGGMGPGGECLCPNCGHREPHRLGEPCYSRKCPRCGTPMARA